MKWAEGDHVTNPNDIQQMEEAVRTARQGHVIEVKEVNDFLNRIMFIELML